MKASQPHSALLAFGRRTPSGLALAAVLLLNLGGMTPTRSPADLLPPDGIPEGWAGSGAAHIYTGDGLYQHVDGGAEVYFQHGFVRAAVKRYALASREVALEVYDMGSPRGAAEIFEINTSGSASGHEVGQACVVSDLQILFRRDRYYVTATTYEKSLECKAAMAALASAVDERIGRDGTAGDAADHGATPANSAGRGATEGDQARRGATEPTGQTQGEKAMTLTLTSPSFQHMGQIPIRHTCEDKNISPALNWTGLPAGTRSLALIVDDPDAPDPKAPKVTWVHWVVYNIPPECTGLPEAVQTKDLPKGTAEGISDYKRGTWGGPCPPIGRHRYFFKLYALDATLTAVQPAAKPQLLKAMERHILAQTELIGTYQKTKS
jgi:Raf kinase inhibitor-like YbhB/YbcL family protein